MAELAGQEKLHHGEHGETKDAGCGMQGRGKELRAVLLARSREPGAWSKGTRG